MDTPEDLAVPAAGLRERTAVAAGGAWPPAVSAAADLVAAGADLAVAVDSAAAVFVADVCENAIDEIAERRSLCGTLMDSSRQTLNASQYC